MVRAGLLGRGATLVIAAAALAWLVVSLVDWRSDRSAEAMLYSSHRSHAAFTRAIAETTQAQTLRPGDEQPAIVRARLLFTEGELRRSTALLEQIVKREPQNLTAWTVLAFYTQSEPVVFRRAARRVHQLAPTVAPR